MRGRESRAGALAARTVGACALAWALLACLTALPALAATGYATVHAACRAPSPGQASCTALVRTPLPAGATPTAAARAFTAGDGASSPGPAGGLTPGDLAGAYGYEGASGGAGQTIGIVDAYNDPRIEEDLQAFDRNYRLPECTSASGCFTEVDQSGGSKPAPTDHEGWSVETSLDVETAHSVCPKCHILLVEANNATFAYLADAVDEAVARGADEVSNSYAGPEEDLGGREIAAYDHPGVVIAAATGDDGYDDYDLINEEGAPGVGMPNAPASLPTVVAVGGTTLKLNSNGTRATETVWNRNGAADKEGLRYGLSLGATGGGCSTLFTAPPWQQSSPGFAAAGCGQKRLSADVAAVADPYTGFDIYDTFDCGPECEEFGIGSGSGWLTIGGTSLATPLISALYGLAGGSGGVPYPALTLYGHLGGAAALYDVSEGANGFCDGESSSKCKPDATYGQVDCEGTTACNAAVGLDGPSGVGTPDSLEAFAPLYPTAAFTPPASPQAGEAAAFSAAGSSDPYPGGSIASYSWQWGDETPAGSGVSPTHTFAHLGTYRVTLTVTDDYGLTSQQTQSVTVGGTPASPAPASSAKESPVAASVGEVATFHAAAPPPPDALLAGSGLAAGASGELGVRISCPAGVSICEGTVTLRTLGAVLAASGARPAVLTLAHGPFGVPGGQTRPVRLRLSARARALLGRVRRLRVRVTIAAHDGAGASHTAVSTVTLRLAAARPRS